MMLVFLNSGQCPKIAMNCSWSCGEWISEITLLKATGGLGTMKWKNVNPAGN
jgi:hypothetical protein